MATYHFVEKVFSEMEIKLALMILLSKFEVEVKVCENIGTPIF